MIKLGKVVNKKKVGRTWGINEPYDTYIIQYGLTKEDVDLMCKKSAKNTNFNLIETKDIVDCVGLKADLVVLNTDVLTKEDIKIITEFEDVLDNVILIGNNKIKLRKSKYYKTVKDFIPNIKYAILSKQKEVKKRADFSTQVLHVLMVLKAILNKPGISTNEIAEKLELSPRTVLRNIETLRMLPENIEYDKTKRGWYIEENFSFLLSDIK